MKAYRATGHPGTAAQAQGKQHAGQPGGQPLGQQDPGQEKGRCDQRQSPGKAGQFVCVPHQKQQAQPQTVGDAHGIHAVQAQDLVRNQAVFHVGEDGGQGKDQHIAQVGEADVLHLLPHAASRTGCQQRGADKPAAPLGLWRFPAYAAVFRVFFVFRDDRIFALGPALIVQHLSTPLLIERISI